MINHINSKYVLPERVVIIGGSGFIGKKLILNLNKANIKTLNISSTNINLKEEKSVDLLKKIIKAKDVVVMLAAITPDKAKDNNVFIDNISIMNNLINAIKDKKISQLIYFSSDAIYGRQQGLISEKTMANPITLYGVMHYTREKMIDEIAKYTPTVILRPTMVYGLGDTHNSYGPNRFIKTLLNNTTIQLIGEGEEKRDYIYIDDIAIIVEKVIYKKSIGTANLASGSSYSFFEVAQIFAKTNTTEFNLNKTERKELIKDYRNYDVTNLYKAFPELRVTQLEEGIQKYLYESKKMLDDL